MKYHLESVFQADLIPEIESLFPGCFVMKNDANTIQGFPDLIILYNDRWATLEVKIRKDAHQQPNQDYYVGVLDDMSFSRFIYPENKEEVLRELQYAFSTRRSTRVSKCK